MIHNEILMDEMICLRLTSKESKGQKVWMKTVMLSWRLLNHAFNFYVCLTFSIMKIFKIQIIIIATVTNIKPWQYDIHLTTPHRLLMSRSPLVSKPPNPLLAFGLRAWLEERSEELAAPSLPEHPMLSGLVLPEAALWLLLCNVLFQFHQLYLSSKCWISPGSGPGASSLYL